MGTLYTDDNIMRGYENTMRGHESLMSYNAYHDHFFSLSTYLSHPSFSSVSTLPRTSSSSDLAYASISAVRDGEEVPSIRIASKAALVELFMPTVATGIPR